MMLRRGEKMEEKMISGVKTTFPESEEATLKQMKQWIFNLFLAKEKEKLADNQAEKAA